MTHDDFTVEHFFGQHKPRYKRIAGNHLGHHRSVCHPPRYHSPRYSMSWVRLHQQLPPILGVQGIARWQGNWKRIYLTNLLSPKIAMVSRINAIQKPGMYAEVGLPETASVAQSHWSFWKSAAHSGCHDSNSQDKSHPEWSQLFPEDPSKVESKESAAPSRVDHPQLFTKNQSWLIFKAPIFDM